MYWAGGETGIHAGFRNLSHTGWRFESSPAHYAYHFERIRSPILGES